MPELGEERRGGYLRNRRKKPQAAHLVRSETVAKFSSFRQLRVSTINKLSAVTAVTVRRDGNQ